MRHNTAAIGILVISLGGLGSLACDRRAERPEPPAIPRDVALVERTADGGAAFTHPFVPGLRTTLDGRVAVNVQGPSDRINLYLFVPEKLGEPVMVSEPGAGILASTTPYSVPFDVDEVRHHMICEAAAEFLEPGRRANPYSCGPGGAHDCYDVTHLGTSPMEPGEPGAQLLGTPMTVEVTNPKTADARIVDVRLGETVRGAYAAGGNWHEPTVTYDGRLLSGRRLDKATIFLTWTNPATGRPLTRTYDLAYSLMPDDAEPCDVRAWTEYHPITHAPYDPRMIGRYGVAAFPFRDAEGKLIPDGEELGVSYPWLDRKGDNLTMTGIDSKLFETQRADFPRRCVEAGCESFREDASNERGHFLMGLWTRGKLVVMDNLLNNIDWGLPMDPASQQWVTLYRDANGAPVEVRLGAGRPSAGKVPPGSSNPNIFDSVENLFNFHGHMRPVSPADVVWLVSNGKATDELVFDDYLNLDGFIVSSMQFSATFDPGLALFARIAIRDGFLYVPALDWLRELDVVPDRPGWPFYHFSGDVHIQNAATSTRWNVPAFGLVPVGTGRAEPVALGGVKGKGFWLTGGNSIRYEIPEQPRPTRGADWHYSIFVDGRFADDGDARTLLAFPDGSSIALRGRSGVVYRAGEEVVREIALPAPLPAGGWAHLGWNVLDENRTVEFQLNGFALDDFRRDARLFELAPGALTVGASDADASGAFRGWVDEFKIFAQPANPEIACNRALGTLAGVVANEEWSAVAAAYPAWAHERISAALAHWGRPTYARYACWHDYASDFAAHRANLPEGTIGVRESINFPEGPLVLGRPRPDTTSNAFCLSCHGAGQPHGLSLAALEAGDAPVEDDPRRQPAQPFSRRVFGNVPAGWIAPGAGVGGPEAHLVAPPEGLPIDPWILPPAAP